MKRKLAATLSLLALLAAYDIADGVEIHPFYARHFSPLVQTFGLPSAEDGEIAPQGTLLARIVLDVANTFHDGVGPRQFMWMDGETFRTTIALRYGFTERLEGGVDIPVVNHSSGIFDGFIESFHRWIGSPKNNGAGNPRNALTYIYARDGEDIIDIRDDVTAFGDLSVSAAWRLSSTGNTERPVALRVALMLPTGKASRMAGSGGTEGSVQLALSDKKTLKHWNTALFSSGGVLYIGSDTFIGDLRRPLVGFGTVGAGWTATSWMAIKAQIQAHTALSHEKEFLPLSWAVEVMSGFTFALPGGIEMDLGISENILQEAAPDVGFQLGFRKRFGG